VLFVDSTGKLGQVITNFVYDQSSARLRLDNGIGLTVRNGLITASWFGTSGINSNAITTFTGVDTSAFPVTVSLPSTAAAIGAVGTFMVIKDEKGNAATNPITVNCADNADRIDGATTKVINTNYGVLRVYSSSSNSWMVW
jgi:hypothetical protein